MGYSDAHISSLSWESPEYREAGYRLSWSTGSLGFSLFVVGPPFYPS
jgi:hypothetical protein